VTQQSSAESDATFDGVRQALMRFLIPGGIGPEFWCAFVAAPHVIYGQYGCGPTGLESRNGDHRHPDWWQLIWRGLPDQDADPWDHSTDWLIAGNREVMMADLAKLILTDWKRGEIEA
jgi:hypothetical protein